MLSIQDDHKGIKNNMITFHAKYYGTFSLQENLTLVFHNETAPGFSAYWYQFLLHTGTWKPGKQREVQISGIESLICRCLLIVRNQATELYQLLE